jgi:hypothetical protein
LSGAAAPSEAAVPLIGLSLLIQVALIVHVVKTGRNTLWIWAIALLPPAGPLAYLVVEILPDLFGGRAARRAKSGVRRMIDPDRDLRRASAEVEISGNVDARRRLAEELYERRRYDGAIEVYAGGLKGIFEHDPSLLSGMARALEADGELDLAEQIYAALAPEYPGAEARLRYGLLLKRRGKIGGARREFKEILDSAALGPAHYRKAQAEWLDRARRESA